MSDTLWELRAAWTQRKAAEHRWERLVRKAHKEGHSLRQIAASAGVSHTAIAKILAR